MAAPPSLLSRLIRTLRALTLDQWRLIDEEYLERDRPTYDYRPLVVLVVSAVSLALQYYLGDQSYYKRFFPSEEGGKYWELGELAWWAGWRCFGYLVIPLVTIALMPGERIRDYFLSIRGFLSKMWIYVGLFAVVLPFVLMASQKPAFHVTYPFYRLANRSRFDFWAWELCYAAQFFSLEFFFRGFMLKALGPRFGHTAIFVMVVPYCMIHFGKPLPETLAAIIAGTVLGTLSMRTRSIWGGALIHVSVAMTMDLLALGYCPPPGSGLPCSP